MTFRLNPKQVHAVDMMAGDQTHTMLFGGSRSGKSFIILRTIIFRAIRVPRSRHLLARFRLAHITGSLIAETWPNVIRLCYPELEGEIVMKKQDGYFLFPNGSEIWWAGLDDKDRTEKILGKEFASVFLNECSQIPWASRNLLMTRLAQKTWRDNPADPDNPLPGLRLKAYYDENPPLKAHWTYKVFIEKKSPDTNKFLPNPDNYNCMLINPVDNRDNVDAQYFEELDNLPERQRKRFRDGQFGEAGEGALWTEELLEQQQIRNEIDLPDFSRIVIAIDPSGADSIDDTHRDEIGIIVAGIGVNGKGYVLEDLTIRGSPMDWATVAVQAYRRWGADRIIAEINYGGAMVKAVIQEASAKLGVPIAFSEVTATRGKHVRAEPIAAMYEAQDIWHVQGLGNLEAELCMMTTAGYLGDRSPNRADALVWALTALFHSIVKASREEGSSRGITTPRINLGHSAMKARMLARRR